MIAFRHILCPVDFSEGSRHALDHAMALAMWYGGTVTVLHVLPQPPIVDPMMGPAPVILPEDIERVGASLKRFATEEAGTTPLETDVRIGSPAATIVEVATSLPADVIVLGTHGRTGVEHLMLGSVTERVLRQAECPVLTVPSRAFDAVPLGPVMFHRILCATDFSPASDKALQYAEALAQETRASLTVMHVVEPRSVFAPVPSHDALMAGEATREATLARIRELAPRGVAFSQVAAEGKPYVEILRHAREAHSDLIVIGVHSGFAERFHLGSTTNQLVRRAECPVLSLRA